MIYFIANNGYHLFDISLHLESLKADEVTLILVAHMLDNCAIPPSIDRVISIGRVPLEQGKLKALNYARGLPRTIRKEIELVRGDTLFMYTEYELANQIIARVFQRANIPVYLIEDGGFGTYLPFRQAASERLNLREMLQQRYERLMPGLAKSRIHKVNGEWFRAMDDSLLTGLLLYRDVQVARKMPRHLISRPNAGRGCATTSRGVVFLNEPIYQHYQPMERYLTDLVHIVAMLTARFEKVHFKFHPRETAAARERIHAALANFESLEYWRSDLPVEFALEEFPERFACSYISTALLNLCQFGIEPIFVYQLLPDLRDEPMFLRATETLRQLGYRFPESWDAISPFFSSGICQKLPMAGAKTLLNFARATPGNK